MLALPCCRRCGGVDLGDEGAEGASATGSEGVVGHRAGGGARGACPLLTWWPSTGAAFVP